MTASEKLRALGEPEFDYLGPDPNDMDGEKWGDSYSPDAIQKMLAALPLIADVVEAAEDLHALVEMNESVGRCLDSRTESLRAGAALAALSEYLEAS